MWSTEDRTLAASKEYDVRMMSKKSQAERGARVLICSPAAARRRREPRRGRQTVVMNYSLIARYDVQADTSFAVGENVTIQRRPPMPLGSASHSPKASWSQETHPGSPIR